jgi:hypothetical protein
VDVVARQASTRSKAIVHRDVVAGDARRRHEAMHEEIPALVERDPEVV